MEETLQSVGLSELQAKIYLYLLNYSAGRKPKQVAESFGTTRTNAYKILDSLVAVKLAHRSETTKTFTYFAEDPIALTNFVAEARNHAKQIEQTVNESMNKLRNKYQKHVSSTEVRVSHGKTAIIKAFKKQLKPGGEIYFIKSRADIPFFGYDTMRLIRKEPIKYGMHRFGITPDAPEISSDPAADQRSGLTRTLIPQNEYRGPVEWTVSGNELVIICYNDIGTAIHITNPLITESFRQIWHSLDKRLRQ